MTEPFKTPSVLISYYISIHRQISENHQIWYVSVFQVAFFWFLATLVALVCLHYIHYVNYHEETLEKLVIYFMDDVFPAARFWNQVDRFHLVFQNTLYNHKNSAKISLVLHQLCHIHFGQCFIIPDNDINLKLTIWERWRGWLRLWDRETLGNHISISE